MSRLSPTMAACELPAVLLVEFHDQQLVVRNGKLRQGVHRAHGRFPGNLYHLVVAAYRIQYRFLNSRAFGHFLIGYLKPDEVRVERHVGTVLCLRVRSFDHCFQNFAYIRAWHTFHRCR